MIDLDLDGVTVQLVVVLQISGTSDLYWLRLQKPGFVTEGLEIHPDIERIVQGETATEAHF